MYIYIKRLKSWRGKQIIFYSEHWSHLVVLIFNCFCTSDNFRIFYLGLLQIRIIFYAFINQKNPIQHYFKWPWFPPQQSYVDWFPQPVLKHFFCCCFSFILPERCISHFPVPASMLLFHPGTFSLSSLPDMRNSWKVTHCGSSAPFIWFSDL